MAKNKHTDVEFCAMAGRPLYSRGRYSVRVVETRTNGVNLWVAGPKGRIKRLSGWYESDDHAIAARIVFRQLGVL